MFSPRQRPMLLVAERLLSLRLSMNTPVVATDELPAGPARAAIAIHSEAGSTRFTVAVRSLRQGVSVLSELDGEDVTQPDGLALALDASLSFGEGMGFLFDDDMIVDRSPATLRQAVSRLRELVSSPTLDVGDVALADREPLEDDDSEILLDDAVEQAPVEAPAGRSQPPASADVELPASLAPGGPMLTKFRANPLPVTPSARPPAAPAAAPARKASGGGAPLGRVQPIRMRAPGAVPAVPALLRLLAAF
jgi:hypothetical protein